MLKLWQKNTNKTVAIDSYQVKIEESLDNSQKHIDTKLVIYVDNSRFVLHAYNTTQKLMIQGKNCENFALNCLVPFFTRKIEDDLEGIEKYNNDVKDTLGTKKGIKKTGDRFNCPQCELITKSNGELRVHMKSCHTKPGICSPQKRKFPKILDEDTSLLNDSEILAIEIKEIPENIAERKTPVVEPVKSKEEEEANCLWEECDFKTNNQTILKEHFEEVHMEYLRTKYLSNDNKSNEHCIETEVQIDDILSCQQCDFETESAEQIEDHNKKNIHSIKIKNELFSEKTESVGVDSNEEIDSFELENPSPCPFCDLPLKNLKELKTHILTTHGNDQTDRIETVASEIYSKCEECEFVVTPGDREKHMQSEHTKTVRCEKCSLNFSEKEALDNHNLAYHKEPREPFPCDTCGLVLATFGLLQEHINNQHRPGTESCKYCQHIAHTKEDLKEHVIQEHEDVVILHTVGMQVNNLTEKLEDYDNFKGEVMVMLKMILENQITIKQELDQSKNSKAQKEPAILNKASVKIAPASAAGNPKEPKSFSHVVAETSSKTTSATFKTSSPAFKDSKPVSKPSVTVSKSKFNQKPKLLYVADSVGHTVSARNIEKKNNCRVVTAKAYSATYNTAARWPEKNFKDVVKRKLENQGCDIYDTLVLSAPTVDITNLDTSQLSTNQSTQYFQDKIKESSKNMFSLAEKSLLENPNLKKVVLMEHPPRFDEQNVDPLSLKPKLAKIANSKLGELWLNSELKNKIFIGQHSLESSGTGESHYDRYSDWNTGHYDGVHF